MKIRGELLKVHADPYDVKGDRLELEARPAERILLTDAPITGSIDQQNHGMLRASVNIQGTVGQFANGLRTMCAQCKHFDMRAWEKRKKHLEGSKEGVQTLNNMRWAFIQEGLGAQPGMPTTPDDEEDLEAAINFMGICRALSEMQKDEIVVHPMGGCPPEVCSTAAPLGYFENTNLGTEKAGNAAYDQVMRNAQTTK